MTGRLTSLSIFLSKASDKAYPFTQCLKSNTHFQWTKECEQAFLKLNETLAAPLILIKPSEGRSILLYLCVTDKAISAVLVQEAGMEQRTIYFISKMLQGAELGYQKLKKVALAIVVAARRLRYYFQNFQVIVKTYLPVKQVLQKIDLAKKNDEMGNRTVRTWINI